MHGTISKPNAQRTQRNELNDALASCRSAFLICAAFSLLINVLMLASPIYMLQVYDRVLTTGHVETLTMITLITAVALAVMCALDGLRTVITIRVGCWLNERLGPVFLACGIRGRLNGDPAGAQCLHDIGQVQSFIATQGLTAFFDFPWVPLFVALIWMLHPLLGMVALSSAVALLVLSVVNEVVTRRASEDANKAQIQSLRLADAAIRNAEVVHSMAMLEAMTARWAAFNGGVADGLRRGGELGGVVLALTKFVRFFVQSAVLGIGAWLVLKSELTPGSMIAASILLGRALAPVEMAMGAWRNFMSARFAYGRLRKAIEDYPAEPPRMRLPAPTGTLRVEDVTYFAPNTNSLVLSRVSFTVAPGEVLAIVGPSGAGKSTLCRLLVGLSSPNVGEIRLDGSPIHHWDPAQIGAHIGFLPQDVELFAGTVRENIARMKAAAADEDVLQAAMLAHAHDMIQRFPRGYDTEIGDGGVRLSGGQRQRIGLARAVFGAPQLIILDEPNANLDHAGETALGEALISLKRRGAALIIVGHKASTLDQADKILVLKEGFVAMCGPRDEVLEALRSPAFTTSHAMTAPPRPPAPHPAGADGASAGSDGKTALARRPIAVRPSEAARLTGVSRSSVFQAIRAGHLPARKYGRRTLILTDELWAWVADLPSRALGALNR